MSEAPGAWKYCVTGVSECSQQSSNLEPSPLCPRLTSGERHVHRIVLSKGVPECLKDYLLSGGYFR